ncbi:hypothetical protein [Profundibacter amoris]|nr:hypothetical protein [Profundibacter amoris]
MASQKTIVIGHLFDKFWDKNGNSLTKSLMSLDDVAQAIRECNKLHGTTLSDRNPANFMKDLLRGANASKNWPQSVAKQRFTGVQRTSDGECFEFIPYKPGQTEPFPDAFKVRANAPVYPIQSISMPLVTKSFGRSDETWLVQTAINLRVVETHFAIAPAFPMLEVAHLQMGIKLRSTEIDALFLGKVGDQKNPESVLITCEAKQAKDPLIQSQIINQVQAAFAEANVETVVPIGLRTVKGVGFYLTEFEAIKRADAPILDELALASDALYQLHPAVKGI